MNKNYFQAFFRSLPDAYLILGTDIPKYTIVDANDAFAKLANLPSEEIKGKSIFELYPILPHGENVGDISALNQSLEKCISETVATQVSVKSYSTLPFKTTLTETNWTIFNTPALSETNDTAFIIHKPVKLIPSHDAGSPNAITDSKFQEALLNARTEATPDGVLVVDGRGKIITFNRKFAEVWQIPEEIMNRKDDNLALSYAMNQLVNPQEFIDRVRYLYAHPDKKSYDKYFFKDGRIAESHGLPIKGADGTYYGWAWYLRDITEREHQLLAVEKIRQKVARDLHDDLGSTLTTILLLSEIAKIKLDKNLNDARDLLRKISDHSSHMMEALSDIVWSINPINDSMDKIIGRMREYAVTLFEAKKIDFEFHVDRSVEDAGLNTEARLDFFLIFKESINNLVKYARCTKAEIKITFNNGVLFMGISDNGIGFDVNNHRAGNGIVNIYKRARQINGRLEIASKANEGTNVTLFVRPTDINKKVG